MSALEGALIFVAAAVGGYIFCRVAEEGWI
jgi:hypothetical protein